MGRRSVAFDDLAGLNLLLLELYGSLPGEPALKEDTLSASDIVSEALEYILLLKKMLKNFSTGNEPILTKSTQVHAHAHSHAHSTPVVTHTPLIKPVPFAQLQEPSIQHTKLVKVVYPEPPARPSPSTSAAPAPTSGVSLVSVVPKFTTVVRPISIAPPVSLAPKPVTLPMILPKSGINSSGIKLVSSSAPSGTPLGHSLLKKPVTIILQPQSQAQPGRAPGQQQPLQQQFRIVNGSLVNISNSAPVVAKSGQGAENEMPNIRIEACESLRKETNNSPGGIHVQDSEAFDKAHGLICGSYCSCELNQDDVPLKPAYKAAVFSHLRKHVTRKTETDELSTGSFQDAFFGIIIDSLSRREMHKLLKMVLPTNSKWRESENSCVVFRQERSPSGQSKIERGNVTVNGASYPVNHLMFKLFRQHEIGNDMFDNLITTSRKECRASRNAQECSSSLCLNPWHFESIDKALTTPVKDALPHTCEHRLRVTTSALFYSCPFCGKKTKEFGSGPLATETVIKEEIVEDSDDEGELKVDEEEDTNLEQMDKEFEELLDNFEQEVMNEEGVKEDDGEDGQAQLSSPTKAAATRKRSASPVVEASPVSSRSSRCWRCIQWYKDKESLNNHNCLPSIVTVSMFCCQYCGYCDSSVKLVRGHIMRCRELGLSPVAEVLALRSPDSRPHRAKRPKKSLEGDTTCHQCGIEFANNAELVLHAEKTRCKSIQCGICNKFFANSRTHQNHDCLAEDNDAEGIIVVKTSDSSAPDLKPVRCEICEASLCSASVLELHSREAAAKCNRCQVTFQSLCEIQAHSCSDAPHQNSCSHCKKAFVSRKALAHHAAKCALKMVKVLKLAT